MSYRSRPRHFSSVAESKFLIMAPSAWRSASWMTISCTRLENHGFKSRSKLSTAVSIGASVHNRKVSVIGLVHEKLAHKRMDHAFSGAAQVVLVAYLRNPKLPLSQIS